MEVIYHAAHTTAYKKETKQALKTIVCQNNLSTIAVFKITGMKYK